MTTKNTHTVKKRRAKMTWRKIPTQGVLIINGHRGEGKSALGLDRKFSINTMLI